MIHTLDTKAADYIPELGDGFEEGSEGSENAQGLQVADYYADADGEGIYYITYKIETAKKIEQLFVLQEESSSYCVLEKERQER